MLASCCVSSQPLEHGGMQLDTQPKKSIQLCIGLTHIQRGQWLSRLFHYFESKCMNACMDKYVLTYIAANIFMNLWPCVSLHIHCSFAYVQVRGCVIVDLTREVFFFCDDAYVHICVCLCVCKSEHWARVGVEFTQALPAA